MSLEYINAWAFTLHFLLLCVELYALHTFFNLFILNKAPRANSYMLVFKRFQVYIFTTTLIMALLEIYFLYCFFLDLDVYLYEYSLVAYLIGMILLTTHFIVKGDKSDG